MKDRDTKDLKNMSWSDFVAYKLFVECAPHLVKNRRQLLTKIELERQRRLEYDLIPKDLPDEPPF